MTLTPEERRRIYEEEKARIEAEDQINQEKAEQEAEDNFSRQQAELEEPREDKGSFVRGWMIALFAIAVIIMIIALGNHSPDSSTQPTNSSNNVGTTSPVQTAQPQTAQPQEQPSEPAISTPYTTTLKVTTGVPDVVLFPCCDVNKVFRFMTASLKDTEQMIADGYPPTTNKVLDGSTVSVAAFYTIGKDGVAEETHTSYGPIDMALIQTAGGRRGYINADLVLPAQK